MNISLLIDMNLAPAWVERFAGEGWTPCIGRRSATLGRPTRWSWSAHELMAKWYSRTIWISAILANTRADGPSVIQVRAENVTPESLGDLVVIAIRDHAQSLEPGALLTVDESTMRVRVLPISQR